MHYLEDDLELLHGLPGELKRRCYEMRELESRAEKMTSQVKEESREFFDVIGTLSIQDRERRYKKIKETYDLIRELREEKLEIAKYLRQVLERYQGRVEEDLLRFKYELEADTAGVTETVEKDLCDSLRSVNALINQRDSLDNNNSDYAAPAATEHQSPFERRPSTHNSNRMNGHRASTMCDDNEPTSSISESDYGGGGGDNHHHSHSQQFATPDVTLEPPPFKRKPTRVEVRQSAGPTTPSALPMPSPSSSSGGGGGGGRGSMARSTDYPHHPQQQQRHFSYHTPMIDPTSCSSHHHQHHDSPSSSFYVDQSPSSSSTAMPATFGGGGQESLYGRPVKLTSRVQEMLQERRQVQHNRVGRPPVGYQQQKQHRGGGAVGIGPGPIRYTSTSQSDDIYTTTDEGGNNASVRHHPPPQMGIEMEEGEGGGGGIGEEEEEETEDHRLYCICQQKSHGDMVACDNRNCPFEWFHYPCVGINGPPKGKWFCPSCSKEMRRSQSAENNRL